MTSTFPRWMAGRLRFLALLAPWLAVHAGALPSDGKPAIPATVIPAEARSAESADLVAVLQRARDASRTRSYTGTFVVMSSSGSMASSRIWHFSEGGQQIERMETLTGSPRLVFRRNDQVVTFLPDTHVARTEQREVYGLFPHLPRLREIAPARFYLARTAGAERVAGFDTEVVHLLPRDALRYGYRLWVERHSGFAVQLQTLDQQGHVLEQAAFSDLQLDVPSRAADRKLQAMPSLAGWQVEKLERIRTSAEAEGWLLRTAVPGFEAMDCYKRAPDSAAGSVQWIFSDGLATVSLFIEPYGARPRQEWQSAAGMTQMVGRRVAADWWLTAMGEVPPQTLRAFAAALERRP